MPTPKKAAAKNAGQKTSSGQDTIKPNSDAAEGLKELFVDSLKDIYWAEKALTKALPKMQKNATAPELQQALADHLQVTQEQVSRLEQVFEMIGKKAQAKKCEAMDGLIKESQDIMESTEPGPVRDAGIIAAGQKVEHYEIATYGTLYTFATLLGENEAAELLQETLEEEKEADATLTEVATSSINLNAMNEEGEEDEEEDDDDTEDDDEEEEDEEKSAGGKSPGGKSKNTGGSAPAKKSAPSKSAGSKGRSSK